MAEKLFSNARYGSSGRLDRRLPPHLKGSGIRGRTLHRPVRRLTTCSNR